MLIKVWAKASRHTCHAALTSSYKDPSLSSGKPQAASSTSALKTNPLFPVRILYLLTKCADEIKWGLRMPNRFAMRQLSLNYEDEVQKQILTFIRENGGITKKQAVELLQHHCWTRPAYYIGLCLNRMVGAKIIKRTGRGVYKKMA